jgi:WD40 repeat protein
MWHDNPVNSRVIEDVRRGKPISRVAHAQTVDAIYSTADDALELREASGKIVKRVEDAHKDFIFQLDVPPYGNWVATLSSSKIKVWRSSLDEHWSLPAPGRPRLCFHPRLPVLVVSGPTTKFYSLIDSTIVGELPEFRATCVAVSPDGKLLATATDDMNLAVWRLTTDSESSKTSK